jgi:uncharacterized protein with FMN-binding domain
VRVRAALGGIFASAAILGIGWQFGSAAAAVFATQATASSGSTSAAVSPGSTTSTSSPTAGSATSPSSAASKSGIFVGATETTQFGDVQVEIVVTAGKITDVKALHLTDQGGRSVQISNRAAPILRSEVLQSQSAHVNSVSGATYTTAGYLSSVQSALDKAGL